MSKEVSDDPPGYVAFEVAMEVAVVVDHIHFLMDGFNLFQDGLGSRFDDIVDHLLVDALKISSKDDVEIDGAGEFVHVVPSKDVDYVGE